jgi:hypothetical protein
VKTVRTNGRRHRCDTVALIPAISSQQTIEHQAHRISRIGVGVFVGHPHLVLVANDVGEREIKDYKLAPGAARP